MTCIARHGGDRFGAATDAVDPIGRRAPLGLPCQVHDAELWFSEHPADLERAKALCAGCPARSSCLTGALRRHEPAGVWGGQIFQAGQVIPFKRPRGRPRKNARPPEIQEHAVHPLITQQLAATRVRQLRDEAAHTGRARDARRACRLDRGVVAATEEPGR